MVIITFFSWLIRLILKVIMYLNGVWLMFILAFLIFLPAIAEFLAGILFQDKTQQEVTTPAYPVAACTIIWPYVRLLNLDNINCFPQGSISLQLVPLPAAILLVLLEGLLLRFSEIAGKLGDYRANKRLEVFRLEQDEQRKIRELREQELSRIRLRQVESERNEAIEKAEAARHERIENLISPGELANKQVELQSIKSSLSLNFPFNEKGYRHSTRKYSTRRVTSSERKAEDASRQNNQNQGEL